MKSGIFSIKDAAAEVFAQPFFARASGVAIRMFSDAVNSDSQEAYARHPEQFTLFKVGEFDEETGVISVPEKGLIVLGRGDEFVKNGSTDELVTVGLPKGAKL